MSDVRRSAFRPLFDPAPQRSSSKQYTSAGGGCPPGGGSGWVLVKASDADGDAGWLNVGCPFASDYDQAVLGIGALAYYPQGGIAFNGVYTGASGGSVFVAWNGSTGYAVHTLTNGQVFTPDEPLTAEVLLVGGGQGGNGTGNEYSGDGGYGGEVLIATINIASAQTATVGAGGVANGGVGGDTTFGGLTASGGSGTLGFSCRGGYGSDGAIPSTSSTGAPGVTWDVDGICYGGGGGAGCGIGADRPQGQCGGGQGAGSGVGSWPSSSGTNGLGGGGGGGNFGEGAGSPGGSGIVKVRYSITAEG